MIGCAAHQSMTGRRGLAPNSLRMRRAAPVPLDFLLHSAHHCQTAPSTIAACVSLLATGETESCVLIPPRRICAALPAEEPLRHDNAAAHLPGDHRRLEASAEAR